MFWAAGGANGWFGQKVVWKVSKNYRGPVLIRGRQVDGAHRIKVNAGPDEPPGPLLTGPYELRIDHARPGVSHGASSSTLFPTLGCYAYQIDGIGFSRLIVFDTVFLVPPKHGASPGRSTWAMLRHRRLRVPPLGPAGRCPITTSTTRRARVGFPSPIGPLPGSGPVFPLTLWPRNALLIPPGHLGPWFAKDIRWGVNPAYRGPVLIRGHQVGGPNKMLFQTVVPGPRHDSARLFPPPAGDIRYPIHAVSSMRIPGCYAMQLDGVGFSHTIVFHGVA